MRRLLRVLLALVFALALVGPATSASAHARPYCGIYWGSLAKHAGSVSGSEYLTNIRAGQHPCYDRLVLDVRGGRVSGYDVRYASVFTEGEGAFIPLRGAADLRITAFVHADDGMGHATYDPANATEAVNVTGFRTFKQVAWGNSFEGQSTVGLGVRARLPFRVFVLDGGPGHTTSRLVIDVAHRW
ncbi:AMIN-like domain-containing (lipo)protein [Georgenia yuyongxinii]|uniref:AMIN-like domain-containing protein n=1 Tax=Georgenia yuyongxinii TaxID=2589797 RepID=A0A552WRR3_9MICO|nr:hypothetical protein [Georgenia yuyongxinii]TRW45508.1 hypothetical protein FJ693_09470 [Georgenia yuyongxinii]